MSLSFCVLQASALEERLQKTEVDLKKSREEAQKNMQQLNDANSQLVSYYLCFIISHVTWMNIEEQLTWYSLGLKIWYVKMSRGKISRCKGTFLKCRSNLTKPKPDFKVLT